MRQEKAASVAILSAIFSVLASLAAWVVVLVPGGDVRGSPVFWLLAIPVMCWTTPLLGYRAWAVKTVRLAFLVAPLLAMSALLAAPYFRVVGSLGTHPAMLIILAVTVLLSAVGLLVLRRSSLPGGTRPAAYLPPGTPPKGVRPMTASMRSMLAVGSLSLSGVLVNGVFFSIVASLDPVAGDFNLPWPAALPVGLSIVAGTMTIRGSRGLIRDQPEATRRLRQGWTFGAAGTCLLLALVWIWPAELAGKLALSIFMVPMAVGAVWGREVRLRNYVVNS
ncbi:hypothetical protein [Faunimonas pinastri]|uniref:hypothetical protein n=1 Tax=Faunimonas pinastri TaxID=1855383 RepID=UPI0015A6C7AA|nr:hypothetical protein [Faunimonas pinastri]